MTTVNNYIRNIKVFFNYLKDQNYIKKDIVKNIKQFKNDRKPKGFISDEQMSELLRHIDTTKFHEYRDYIIIQLLLDYTLISKYSNIMNTDNTISLIAKIREKADKFLLKEMEKLGLKNIAPSHGDILSALFKCQEATMTEIANTIHRDRSTVTALVNKLIRFEYVSSKKDLNDNRSSIIYLTEKGKELKLGFKEISEKLYMREYKGISDEEKVIFRDILQKIYNNF